MPNPASWYVYAEQLAQRRLGLPLWHPEPSMSSFGEIEIGDVGYVSEGRWFRLFNALYPACHAINAGGVPEGFTQLEPKARHFHYQPKEISPGPISTTTTTLRKVGGNISDSTTQSLGASYTFTCHSGRGAIAVLGDYGHREWYESNGAFWNYIAANHVSWHAFAVQQDYLVPQEAIILVSGWTKTTEWAIAAVANYGKSHELTISACASSYASASFDMSSETDVMMSWDHRSGSGLVGNDQATALLDSPSTDNSTQDLTIPGAPPERRKPGCN